MVAVSHGWQRPCREQPRNWHPHQPPRASTIGVHGFFPPTETLCAHDGGEERREAAEEGRPWLADLPTGKAFLLPKYTEDLLELWGSRESKPPSRRVIRDPSTEMSWEESPWFLTTWDQ